MKRYLGDVKFAQKIVHAPNSLCIVTYSFEIEEGGHLALRQFQSGFDFKIFHFPQKSISVNA